MCSPLPSAFAFTQWGELAGSWRQNLSPVVSSPAWLTAKLSYEKSKPYLVTAFVIARPQWIEYSMTKIIGSEGSQEYTQNIIWGHFFNLKIMPWNLGYRQMTRWLTNTTWNTTVSDVWWQCITTFRHPFSQQNCRLSTNPSQCEN